MFGKKILTKIFAVLLFISLLISTFMPQLVFAGGGSPGEDPPQVNASGDFSIEGTKIWVDENNEASTRPSSVKIILYQDEEKIDEQTTDAGKDWKYKFDLVNQPYGAKYRIDEADLSNYNYVIGTIVNPEIRPTEISEYIWEEDKYTPNNATKVLVDDKEIIAVKTTSANFNSIILVWTLYPLSSLEEKEIKVSIEKIPELKNAGGYAFISGLGAMHGDESSGNWIKIYKDGDSKQYIEFSHQRHWSMIFYGDIFVETQVFVTPSSITNIYKAPVPPTTSTEATAATTSTTEASTTEETTTTTTTSTEETVATTTTEASTTEETTTTTTEDTSTTTSTTESPTTEESMTTGVPATVQPTTEEQVYPHIPPVISVEKLVKEEKFAYAGDKLHYSFIIKNDGIVPVVKLTVDDPLLGIENLAIIDLTDDPLMPDESYTYEFSGAYVVTEADLDAGKVVNVLAVTAESVEGAKAEAEADVTTPREQVSPQTPDLPQTGEYTGYRAGIYSLLLGGAVVLVAINRRKKISYQSDNAD